MIAGESGKTDMGGIVNMKRFHVSCFMFHVLFLLFALILILLVPDARAQKLSFSNHREIKIPEYALLRIGPFYSDLSLSVQAGYRYTKGEGTGTDFLYANRRGVITEDGADYPLITFLRFQNYLLLSRTMDLEFSGKIVSEYYPNGTQENDLYLDLVEEGAFGNLSTEIVLSPFLKMFVYDELKYVTEYVDTRGFIDEWGGQRYEHLNNKAGVMFDWLMTSTENFHFEFGRRDVVAADEEMKGQDRVEWEESLAYEQQVNMFTSVGLMLSGLQSQYTVTNRGDVSAYNAMLFANSRLTRETVMNVGIGYSEGSSDAYVEGSVDSERYTAVSEAVIGMLSFMTEVSDDMVHSYGYQRNQQGGFTSDLEIWNGLFYRFRWQGDFTSLKLSSEYNFIETSRAGSGEYVDWKNTAMISHELNNILTLNLSMFYTIRENGYEVPDDVEESGGLEWTEDYDTWSGKFGTSLAVTESIDFIVSLQHVERSSGAEKLNYSRDLIRAYFVYTHSF